MEKSLTIPKGLINGSTVETVVLLNNLNSSEKNHVSVDVDMDEYRRIKDNR